MITESEFIAAADRTLAAMLADKGVTIWLDCPFEMVQRRVAGDESRPLARDAERFRESVSLRWSGEFEFAG